LDPLGTTQGDLAVDYDIGKLVHAKVPITGGVIDFDKVTNPNIGWEGPFNKQVATLGVSETEIYWQLGAFRNKIYRPPHAAGLTPETIDDNGPDNSPRILHRGKVDLQKMIEGALNEPTSATPEDPQSLDALNPLSLRTQNLQLGGGRLGKGENYLVLDAQQAKSPDGTPTPNMFTINSVSVGEDLTLQAELFKATRGNFVFAGQAGKTGAIQVRDFKISIGKLGSANKAAEGASPVFNLDVTITAKEGTVEDIRWGNLSILKADNSGLTGEPDQPAGGKK
jgi:hypothetical protein